MAYSSWLKDEGLGFRVESLKLRVKSLGANGHVFCRA